MIIRVKSNLTKSRNPTEHKMKLEGKKGKIVHVLPDGYCLIDFGSLEWYVHDTDFYISETQ